MKPAGRNGPCPCGSGRRFKDCCCGADNAAPAGATSGSTRDSAIAKLLAFAFRPEFDDDHLLAETAFWGHLLRRGRPGELQWLLESEDASLKYNTWFLFDWEIDATGTVTDRFLEEDTARLSAAERRFLIRFARSPLRPYEVEAVSRGRSLQLRDLWNGARIAVAGRRSTEQIVTWDLLAARVTPDGPGRHVIEGGLYLYPPGLRGKLLTRLRRAHRRYQRRYPGDDIAPFFRRHGVVFHHLWLDLVAFAEPPPILTAEGDPLMFCRVVFDTTDVEQVRAAVSHREEVHPARDGRLAWCEPTPDGSREIGRWRFEGGRVVFETTSKMRGARGRSWLERIAGDLVRYRATALEALEETMIALRARERRVGAQEQAENGAGAVRELFDRHYRTWLDRPDPALGQRTPRVTARTARGRERLLERLKQMENGAERAALRGRPPYDFRWLWEELGLDRQRS